MHRATAPFTVGRQAVSGRLVRRQDARRRSVRTCSTCSSRRIIPNDFQYPGGPPIPPYDNAGWTLAYQMGVKFDRVLDGVRWPVREDYRTGQRRRRARSPKPRGAAGYVVSHKQNDAFIAVNRLLKNGDEVFFVAIAA